MLKRRGHENQHVGSTPNVYALKRDNSSTSAYYPTGDLQIPHQQDLPVSSTQQLTSVQQKQFTFNFPVHGGVDVDENYVEESEAFDANAFESVRGHRSRGNSVKRVASKTAISNTESNAGAGYVRTAVNNDGLLRSQPVDGKSAVYLPTQPQPVATPVQDGQSYAFNNMMFPSGNYILSPGVNVMNGNYLVPNALNGAFMMPTAFTANGAVRNGVLPAASAVVPNDSGQLSPATVANFQQLQIEQPQVAVNSVPTTFTQNGYNGTASAASSRGGYQPPAAVRAEEPRPAPVNQRAQAQNTQTLRSVPKGAPSAELFERIRRYCREAGVLYEDPDFPASNESLFNSSSNPQVVDAYRDAEWLRPAEIVKLRAKQGDAVDEPFLFVKGLNRFDLVQGALGNCWVLAAIAAFCERKELVQQVIPNGQSFSPDWYAGVFRFRFARLGEWRDVIIDDRLPTRNGSLIFLHSSSSNEFWGSLLEKAYAKLASCYANLDGGRFEDAMLDLTDGLAEDFELPALRKDPSAARRLESIMLDAFNRDSIMCAGIDSRANMQAQTLADSAELGKNNEILANGLVVAHAYTITNVQSVVYPFVPNKSNASASRLCLIRVRNPWGNNVEWNGAFSDDSPEWQLVSPDFRKKFDVQAADGEFWMPAKDFIENFDRVSLCHLAPEMSASAAKRWQRQGFLNHWIKGLNAGGRPILKDSHCSNPQYHISLNDACHPNHNIIVEIQQPDIRHLQSGASASANRELIYKPIGFVIYLAPPGSSFPLAKDFIRTNNYVARCDNFVTARSYAKRFTLPNGEYVIVPCTADANVESEFFLQVYSERLCTMKDEHMSGETSIPTETVYDRAEKTTPLADKHKDIIQSRFARFAGNTNGELPAHLVPALLKNLPIGGFPSEVPIELAKTLVHYVSDSSALRLTLKDAYRLVQVMLHWCNMFREFDKDQSTTLDASEMQSLLAKLGYSLDMTIIKQLVLRYCDERGQLTLVNSLACIAKLSAVSKILAENSSTNNLSGDTQVSFTLKSLLISIALI